jgi:Tol biopolymer transport system component/DNA-binding winged helix-turn-helix (wHTH) protein
MSRETKRFEFGVYILDAEEKVLLRDGKSVQIPPKVLELLLILVENHGHVVEKEALIERLWANTFVEESNLTFSVRKLRKILGDDAQNPEFIETLRKRGYRFISPTIERENSHDQADAGLVGLGKDPSGSQRSMPVLSAGLTRRILFQLMIAGIFLIGVLAAIYSYVWYGEPSDGVDWTAALSVQLTDQPGIEYFPSISPDGKSFVYAAASESGFDVYLQRVGGRNATNLTPDSEGDDTQPAFSPDGERIAFRSDRDGGGIYVMGISRENLRRVSDFGYHPAWSPDASHLVVSTFGRDRITVSQRGEQGLLVIDVETGEKRELYRGLASFPSWSPGGKRIAYWYYGNLSGRSDIATIPAGGGEPVPVAEGFGTLNWNPVWSPDGKFLYFVSNRGGNQGFWRVRIDEETGKSLSEPEPVVTPSTFSRHVTFSRDETRMIYVQTELQSNIQGVEFDPQKLTVTGSPYWITEGDREVSRAELSPDGTRFQMRLIRRTQDDIVTVARDGSDWRDITDDVAFDRYSRWSPDGRHIAFVSDRSGDSEIWVCSSDGTNPRQLTSREKSGYVSTFPVWSPDGSQIIYSSPTESYLMDPSRPFTGQTPKKLPRPKKGDLFVPWDWSPDGKKLAGTFRPPRRGSGFFSFETGKFTRFLETHSAVPSWLPDSRHLVYNEGNKVILLDTATLNKRELIVTSAGEPRSPFISHDGKLLYYVLHQSESDIWLLDLGENAAGAL